MKGPTVYETGPGYSRIRLDTQMFWAKGMDKPPRLKRRQRLKRRRAEK